MSLERTLSVEIKIKHINLFKRTGLIEVFIDGQTLGERVIRPGESITAKQTAEVVLGSEWRIADEP